MDKYFISRPVEVIQVDCDEAVVFYDGARSICLLNHLTVEVVSHGHFVQKTALARHESADQDIAASELLEDV